MAPVEDRTAGTCGADDALERRAEAQDLCTCRLKADDPGAWTRLLRLFADPDARVRRSALHSITDSTPRDRVPAVIEALEARYHDPDPRLRRRIRKVLAHHRRTGRLTDAVR